LAQACSVTTSMTCVEESGYVPVKVCHAVSGEVFCQVWARATSTSEELKQRIDLARGIPPREQKLLANNRLLADEEDILGPGFFSSGNPVLTILRLDPTTAAREEGRQKALARVHDGDSLRDLAEHHRRDPEVVLAAARQNVCNLCHAAPQVLADCSTMLEAMRLNVVAKCYSARGLWEHREFALEAVKLDGMLLEDAATFREDFEVVMAAVMQNGYALKYAGPSMRSNWEVARAAVQQKGTALCHVATPLKSDRALVLEAVRSSRMAIVHAHAELRDDPGIRELIESQRNSSA